MTLKDEWWTAPAESESGRLIMVTGRDGLDEAIAAGKYIYRIDVSWKYNEQADGMPDADDAALIDEVDTALKETFRKNKIGIITGIYTGDGQRDWVIYTYNLKTFSSVFNRALAELPTVPIVIDAESDPDWEEYRNMRETTYIAPGE